MRRALALASLLFLLPFAPTSLAQAGDVRFDYTVEDAAGDVVLVAANGSERWSEKPSVDIVGYASKVEGANLVQTITFGAGLPTTDVTVELSITLAPSGQQPLPLSLTFAGDRAANVGTQNAGANATVSGSTFTATIPTSKLEGATCFAPRVKVVHDPENDPVTSTDAGRQGWQDEFSLRPHRCVMSFGSAPVLPVEDGMDGTCPPASVPSGVVVNGAWDDPTGDVDESMKMGTNAVDFPTADITRVTSALEGNEVVVRMTVAEFPAERSVPLASVQFALEGKTEEYDFDAKDQLTVSFVHPEHDALGLLADANGETSTSRGFYAWGARDGNTFEARFCASVIPDEARCWAPHASIQYNTGDRPYDEIEFAWNEGPCAGKTSGSTGGSGGAATDDGAGDGTTDGGDDGSGQEDGEEAGTPGFGVVALVAAVVVALALVRRR